MTDFCEFLNQLPLQYILILFFCVSLFSVVGLAKPEAKPETKTLSRVRRYTPTYNNRIQPVTGLRMYHKLQPYMRHIPQGALSVLSASGLRGRKQYLWQRWRDLQGGKL